MSARRERNAGAGRRGGGGGDARNDLEVDAGRTYRGHLLAEAAVMYGILVFIISVAFPFGWLVAINQVPATVAR